MFLGFALATVAIVLLDAGWTHRSLLDVITGQKPATTKSPDPSTPATVDAAAAIGNRHPELKDGIRALMVTVLGRYPGLVVTSTTGGVHAKGSLHYQGRAVDLAGSPSTMDAAAAWLQRTWSAGLTEGIHNPGLSVKNAQIVPPSFWGGVTWQAHRTHIHIAV